MLRSLRPSRRLSGTHEFRLLLALSAAAFVVIVGFHPGETYVDTRMDLYLDPLSVLRDTFSTWVSGSGLGGTNYNNGYLPVAVLTSWGHLVGLPAWLVVRLWRWGLVIVAAAGARRLLADLGGGTAQVGPVARVSAAVLYVANPYVVVGAATTPVLLPYAVFPWLLVSLRRTFDPAARIRAVCAFGLLFFVMGGINAGVVPVVLLAGVVPVLLDARWRERRRWRDLLVGLGGSAAVSLLVSLYWIVGTATALGTASAVAEATEDPRTIATVSSYAETLRGLGGWLLYGGDALGPYRPGFVPYLEQPIVVAATFVLPVLAVLGALLTRHPARRLLTALMALGIVLMVGGFPPGHPSPFGRALFWLFDHVPLTVAFRTTNKAGAIALLGMALLGALGMEAAWRAWSPRGREWLVGGVTLALALALTPVWFGNLLPGRLDIPQYWTAAADDLDHRASDGSVWALPGETNALYRWRPLSVDDFASSMVARNLIYARSFPDGPASSWNFMSGVQEGLGSGLPTTRTLSDVGAYVGASDVLARNDMIWEQMGAPRPADVIAATDGDAGLKASALYGSGGTNVTSARPDLFNAAEARLPPLVRYHVTTPTSAVRLYPTSGQLLAAGDGAAVPSAVWAGLLDGRRPFRLLARTSVAAAAQALEDGGRLLLTDTNRRRSANVHRLDRSGPLVGPDDPVDQSVAVGGSDDQTVATYRGISNVSASSSGSVFGPVPSGRPFLAVDGDPRTAWTMGDFHRGVGQWLHIDLLHQLSLRKVTLVRPSPSGAAIGTVEVTAGGQSVSARFGSDDRAVATFDAPVRADSVRVTVTGVTGGGNNQVGLSEVRIPGVHRVREQARLPLTLERLAGDPALRSEMAGAPVDVLLTRSVIEGETTLDRSFSLPSAQRYRVRAEVRGPAAAWRTCRPLFRVDGRSVRARAVRAARQTSPGTVEVAGCGSLDLRAGSHVLTTRRTPVVDRVLLRTGRLLPADQPATRNLVWSGGRDSLTTTVPASDRPSLLVAAQGFDDRWRASVGGHDLGPPAELNGFALGWELPAGPSADVHLWFAPQGRYEIALGISLATVLLLAGIGCADIVRRRRRRAT